MDSDSDITFVLGPTNTGKTHRSLERMMDFETGMIGLPLRLLAREVYDKLTAKLGESTVALVTGEEKRVPASPKYWVCTVEAMPLSQPVEFLAVDEIQLCAHLQRGHVFTDRLLHARGTKETWFLGSDTMQPLTTSLFPAAVQKRLHRFSHLSFTGTRSLRSLPNRGCAVAFSAARVYELAERVRGLRGGVAVVLGALSPRTRNAQVAMYQSGEVQHLVATDAIGMGLNLDVDHVAFAGLRKFDGRSHRALRAAELAQIAGRAGRHLNNGSFGSLKGDWDEVSLDVAQAIESHRFRPVSKVVWRNSDLDFASIDALLASLSARPTKKIFERVQHADDFEALLVLSRDQDVCQALTSPSDVALLWECCQVPDFRKLMLHQHAGLVKAVFSQRLTHGSVNSVWMTQRLSRVRSREGGLDALTARLASVRILTYISHQSGWTEDPSRWRAETREVEDALGDALHQRLLARFVEVRKTHRHRRARPKEQIDETGPFAQLSKFSIHEPADDSTIEGFVDRVADAEHAAFRLAQNATVWFEGIPFARLAPGKSPTDPTIALLNPSELRAGERSRVDKRLLALGRDLVLQASGGVRWDGLATSEKEAHARALSYQLARNFGVLARELVPDESQVLNDLAMTQLSERGLRLGVEYLYVAQALAPEALELRATLLSNFFRSERPPGVPADPHRPIRDFESDEVAFRFGYHRVGHLALRIDVLESAYRELAQEDSSPTLSALGLKKSQRLRLIKSLRLRVKAL